MTKTIFFIYMKKFSYFCCGNRRNFIPEHDGCVPIAGMSIKTSYKRAVLILNPKLIFEKLQESGTFISCLNVMGWLSASWTEDLMVGRSIPAVAQGYLIFLAHKDKGH